MIGKLVSVLFYNMAMPILIPKRFFTCAVTQNSTEYVGAQNKCLNLVGHLLEIVTLLQIVSNSHTENVQ